MEYNWFVRNNQDQNADYTTSGTYWMRLMKDDGKCMVSLAATKPAAPASEESAFKAMASLTALTAAFVVSTL